MSRYARSKTELIDLCEASDKIADGGEETDEMDDSEDPTAQELLEKILDCQTTLAKELRLIRLEVCNYETLERNLSRLVLLLAQVHLNWSGFLCVYHTRLLNSAWPNVLWTPLIKDLDLLCKDRTLQ